MYAMSLDINVYDTYTIEIMSIKSHKDIVALWPTVATFGSEIGVSTFTALQMNKRNSIGPDYWFAVVAAAKTRGFEGITIELLLRLRPRRKQSSASGKQSNAEQTPVRVLAG